MGCPKFVFLLVTLLSLSSCYRYNVDDTAPTVRIDSPFEGASYRVGDTMRIEYRLSDDVELAEVVFRMHNNTQVHLGPDANIHDVTDIPTNVFIWDTLMTLNAFGTQSDYEMYWAIPTSLTGIIPFHFVIEAMDASGNRSELQEINFNIFNDLDPNAPEIVLTTNPITTFSGNTFVVLGDASDQEALNMIHFELTGSDGTVFEISRNLEGNDYSIAEFVPAPDVEAEYLMTITVTDIGGNETVETVVVNVL